VSHPIYVPDRAVVHALRRVDPLLSVDFVEPPGCFGVFHDLPVSSNLDESAARLARETVHDYKAGGYVVPYHVCLLAAYRLLQMDKLVCLVQEPDGSFRPLDGRVVEKFRRMDYYRRNFFVSDWIRHARAEADRLRDAQQRETDNRFASIENDRVFRRMAVDLIRGMRPIRSVHLRPQKRSAA